MDCQGYDEEPPGDLGYREMACLSSIHLSDRVKARGKTRCIIFFLVSRAFLATRIVSEHISCKHNILIHVLYLFGQSCKQGMFRERQYSLKVQPQSQVIKITSQSQCDFLNNNSVFVFDTIPCV